MSLLKKQQLPWMALFFKHYLYQHSKIRWNCVSDMPLGMGNIWLMSDQHLTKFRAFMQYIQRYMEQPKYLECTLTVVQGIAWSWFPQTVVGIAYPPVEG